MVRRQIPTNTIHPTEKHKKHIPILYSPLNHCEIAYIASPQSRSIRMPNPIKHIILTPLQAEEKALIVAQMKTNSYDPWTNRKITILPEPKSKKKD
jgi:hypothetical protein